ncbi:MAG: sulfide-dependent adenosine diphosphate thiazole synthase [Chloroflexota bacterium]
MPYHFSENNYQEEVKVDEIIISKAIVESYYKELMEYMDVDVAIVGAGPSGLTAGYYLAQKGVKTVIFEKRMSTGGGIWAGGMMFNKIVMEKEAASILDEFGIASKEYERDYLVADSIETATALCYRCVRAGTRIFNLITVEDVMIRENDRVAGLVLNWTATEMANLHVDPLTIRSKMVIDATGHEADVCRIFVRKVGQKLATKTGGIVGEKSMWAETAEKEITDNTKELYPGLMVAGMAVNASLGLPRMGAIFGGMLFSGKRAADVAAELIKRPVSQ